MISMGQRMQVNQASGLLAAIIASSDDAIIGRTLDGLVTIWSHGAERVFGYMAHEMLGKPIAVLAMSGPEHEMPAIPDRLRRCGSIDRYATTARHSNGSALHISLTVSAILNENGQEIGVLNLARDVTPARLAANALRDVEADPPEQQRGPLHPAPLSEPGPTAATLAHELSEPLTAITNYLRTARRLLAVNDAASKLRLDEAISKATEQTSRVGEIINRLRHLANRRSGPS